MSKPTESISIKTTLLNLKWWQATIMIVSILLSGAVFVHFGGNLTIDLQVQARLDYLEVQQQILNETINNPINSSVSGMLKPCSYIFSIHDSYACVINGTDDRGGRLEYYSTNHSLAFNTARGYLGSLATGAPGLIYMRKGTYQVSTDWILGKCTHLTAEVGVYLNVTQNLSLACIVIDGTNVEFTDWLLEELFIDMNSFNGHGIYASWAGRGDMRCKQTLTRLYIREVKAGYWAMWLFDPFLMYATQIHISSAGGGIRLSDRFTYNITEQVYNVTCGNSVFSDIVVGQTATTMEALKIETSESNATWLMPNPANLMQFHRFQCGGGTFVGAGSVGINITNRGKYGSNELSFYDMDIENYETGILLDDAYRVSFFGGLSSGTDMVSGIKFVNATDNIDVFGATMSKWNDQTDGTRNLRMFGGHTWGIVATTLSSHFYGVSGAEDYVPDALPYSYLVYTASSVSYMVDGSSGNVVYYSTNASKVITFAMGNLTSGRTWKEKVVVKGNYTDCYPFLIPSYTILEIQGSLRSVANIVNAGFIGSNSTTQVLLQGGTIDANPDNQNHDMAGILFYGCQNFTIQGVVVAHGGMRVSSTLGEGICIYDCDYGLVTGCESYDSFYDCIKIRGTATNIIVSNNRVGASRTAFGIQVSTVNTISVVVVGNVGINGGTLHCDAAQGVAFIGNTVTDFGSNSGLIGFNQEATDCLVTGNILNVTGNYYGIRFYGATPSTKRPSNNIFQDNQIYLSGTSAVAMQIECGDNNTFQNNVIKATSSNWSGIRLNWAGQYASGYCSENIVRFNNFWNTTVGYTTLGYIKDNATGTDILQNFYNGKMSQNGYGVTIFAGGTIGDLSTTAQEAIQAQGKGATSVAASYFYRSVIVPSAGILKFAYGQVSTAPGAGKNRTFVLQVNGVNSTLTFQILNTATTGNDLVNTVTVVAGDRISWLGVPNGTPAAGGLAISVSFYPTDTPPP